MLAKNIIILSLVHVVRLLLPLLVLPILAGTILPDDFGIYLYAVSFGAWLSVFIEYGFNISATRSLACSGDTREAARIIEETQNAKLMLTILTLPVLAMALWVVPVFKGHTYWAFAAWLLGVFTAFAPIYYFQGREQLRDVAIAETLSGLLVLASVYFFINSAQSFYLLPAILVGAKLVSTGLLTARMIFDLPPNARPCFSFVSGRCALKAGFDLFIFQSAVSFYTSFNVVFLGFFCTPVQVGAFAAAERLMKAGLGFLSQFSNAIFPRLNALRLSDPAGMIELRTRVLAGFIVLGLVGMVTTWFIAPFVVKIMFKDSLVEVVSLLGILAVVIPAIALSNVLGFQYLLVDGREKVFNRVIAAAAAVNLVMASVLISQAGARGMALSWVLTEWFITVILAVIIFSPRLYKVVLKVE